MVQRLLAMLFVLSFILMSAQVSADVRITVSKGDASLCSVIATQAQKYKDGKGRDTGRYVRHYNKKSGTISSDLWDSARKGLGFFNLNKGQRQSQTVQLAFVDKYSTFWYHTKKGSETNGPYFYDFVVPERESGRRTFVDIDLELPCSCFRTTEKPRRCTVPDEVNIHLRGGLGGANDSKLDQWWKSLSLQQQWEIFKREN